MTNEQDRTSQEVSWGEIAFAKMIQNEAFLRLLVEKGIITKDEFIDKIKEINEEYLDKQGKWAKV